VEFIISMFQKGGPLMYPLLLLGAIVIGLIIERAYSLRESKVIPKKTVEEIIFFIKEGRIQDAFAVARHQDSLATEIIAAVLNAFVTGRRAKDELTTIAEEAAKIQLPKLEGYINAIGAIAAIAPLLGFLGTVTGMIQVFEALSVEGLGNPEVLSAGISQALLTTAFGLSIAIPSLAAYWYFKSRVEYLALELENIVINIVYDLADYKEKEE